MEWLEAACVPHLVAVSWSVSSEVLSRHTRTINISTGSGDIDSSPTLAFLVSSSSLFDRGKVKMI